MRQQQKSRMGLHAAPVNEMGAQVRYGSERTGRGMAARACREWSTLMIDTERGIDGNTRVAGGGWSPNHMVDLTAGHWSTVNWSFI